MNLSFKPTLAIKTQNTILSAAFIMALTTGVGAILGLVKSRILTRYFGVSDELAVFYTAEKIPNLVYSVLIVGAIATVFIPVYASLISRDKRRANQTASSMINATLLFFVIFSAVCFVFANQLVDLLAIHAFSLEQVALGGNLMRIMILGQLVLVFGSLATSILQSYRYFILPAFAPVLFNFGMICGVIVLGKPLGIYGAAWGTVIGAVLHLLVQLPAFSKTNFKYYPIIDLTDAQTIKAFKLIPPRLLSVLIGNIIATVNNSLAILISATSVIYLKLATQLQTLPVSLFGLAMAAAALPTLSCESEEKDLSKFKHTFITSLHQTMYLVVPLSAILFVLRIPVVRLVYGEANFPWEATVITSRVLAFYAISIFAQSAAYLITRAFYALKDTYTPVKVSLVTIFLNVALSLIFISKTDLGLSGVSLAFSLTAIVDMTLLLALLAKKVGGFNFEQLAMPFLKIGYSALLMAFTLYIPIKILDIRVFDTTKTVNLIILTSIAGMSGMGTYLLFTKLFHVDEIILFYKLIRKLDLRKKTARPVSESVSLGQ